MCGTLNVTDKGDVNECEHFEGMISMNEFVVGDKNGIMNEANEAAYNLKNFGDNFDGTDEECREAYVEACKKHNVNTDQQDGIFASNILESKLDDSKKLIQLQKLRQDLQDCENQLLTPALQSLVF